MHGGIKARETSLARDWQGQVLYNLFLYWKGRMPGKVSTIDCSISSSSVRPRTIHRPVLAVRPPGFPTVVP